MHVNQVVTLLLASGIALAAPEGADNGLEKRNGKELQLARNLLGTWIVHEGLTERTWGSKT